VLGAASRILDLRTSSLLSDLADFPPKETFAAPERPEKKLPFMVPTRFLMDCNLRQGLAKTCSHTCLTTCPAA
jgi:hypothetical protein